jgi:hypothetical protein
VVISGVHTDECLSQMCRSGQHATCVHTLSSHMRLLPGRGPQHTEGLCPCSCHAGCPLISAKPAEMTELLALCTCTDHQELIDTITRRADQRALRRQAVKTVADRTPKGSDPVLVRADLERELATLGVSVSEKSLTLSTSQIVDARNGNTLGLLRSTFGIYRNIWRTLRDAASDNDNDNDNDNDEDEDEDET